MRPLGEKANLRNFKFNKDPSFVKLFHNSTFPKAIYHTSKNIIIAVNDAFCQLFGYNKKDIVGKNLFELKIQIHPVNYLDLFKTHQEDKNIKIQQTLFSKSGEEINVLTYLNYVDFNNDDYIIITFNDVTEKVKLEKALLDNKILFKLSNELVDIAVWKYDFQTDTMTSSDNFEKLYGLKNRKAWKMENFLNAMHPDDRESSYAIFQKSAEKEGPDNFKFDFRVVHPDKSEHWLNVIGLIVKRNKKGEGTLARGLIADISDRKQTEELIIKREQYLQNVLNNIGDPIFVKDEQSRLISVNDAFCELFKLTRDKIKGFTLFESFPPDEREIYFKNDREVLDTGIENINEESFTLEGEETKIIITRKSRFIDSEGNKFLIGISKDITDLKKTEQEIQKGKEFSEKLISSMAEGLVVVDINKTMIIDVNPSFCEMTGFSKEELVGSAAPFPYWPPEDYEKIISNHEKKFREREDQYFSKLMHKNGKRFPVKLRPRALNDENGNIIAMISTVQDLTEQRKAEKKLIDAKEFSERLISSLSEGLVVIDANGVLIDVNPSFCDMTGFKKEELLGSKEPYPYWPPEDYEKIKVNFNNALKGLEFHYKLNLMRKNGERFPVSIHPKHLKDFKGKSLAFFATIQDLTEESIAEQKLLHANAFSEGLIDQMHDGLVVFDLNTKIISVNPAFSDMCGFAPSELIGKSCPYPFSPPETMFAAQRRHKKLTQGATIDQFETVYMRKDGLRFNAHVMVSSIINFEGERVAYFGTVQDITTQKQYQQKLIHNEAVLKESQQVANIGSYVFDVASSTWTCTEIMEHIFGLPHTDVKDMVEWVNILHPEDKEMILSYFQHNVLENHEKFDKEYRIIRQNNNEIRWVQGFGKLEFNREGHPIKMIGTIQDITDRKNAEYQIVRTNNELFKANEELNQLKKQLEQENVYLRSELELSFNYEEMVYGSTEFSQVLSDVEKVAPTDATVLLLGESGTGKELLARAIHNTSFRKEKPMIKVNCSAIPRELIESELFGHKKGSFTGAVADKIGKFELANGGTLFLDEIGELPLDMQPKILRFLQEGEIEVIGGTGMKRLDVRVIAATNRDLLKEIENKNFREDLYFRLNVFPILSPPLRSRKDDIPLLVEHFVDKFNKKYLKGIKYIADATMEQLTAYNWPGNVREMENLIERAVIISTTDTLLIPGFESEIQKKKQLIAERDLSLDAIQRNHILQVLEQCKWKITGDDGASALLDLKPSTLRDKMVKLGIKRPSNT